ncbi:hypothetical protein OY671_013112, partial [Metschnikowia pulcherrima]
AARERRHGDAFSIAMRRPFAELSARAAVVSAMVTASAVNRSIGSGAFVTQWSLKQPSARAMTMEYAVTGSWDDPKIDPIDDSGKPARKQTPKPRSSEEFIEH